MRATDCIFRELNKSQMDRTGLGKGAIDAYE